MSAPVSDPVASREAGPGLRLAAAIGTVAVLALGCTGPADPPQAGPATGATTSRAVTPSPTLTPTPTPTPDPVHPVSLPALMTAAYDGGVLQVGRVLDRTDAYVRHFVTYRSSGLTISGIMNVPVGAGPFPVLVLNHGYIDPAVYTNGRGLAREQDYLARRGFVVLHTDYRNHAQSDDDPGNELRMRLGYTEDVVNAVLAVKGSTLPFLDRERVGLLGRSMGGGLTLNALVVQPGLVDAAVVYAPVSSDAVDNFDRWIRGEPGRRELADSLVAAYGTPEAAPEFWQGLSAATFFERVSEPVLVHHGTVDESCPIEWSQRTVARLQQLGKDAALLTYEGEPHAFAAAWPASMERTVAFFQAHLTGGAPP